MSPTRPGVYVSEAPLARVVTPPVTTSSVAAFIGTALRGPTNPTLINSWSDFVAQFGDFHTSVTLPYAVFQYFRNGGGGPAYVSRVMGATGAVQATKTWADSASSPADDRIKFTAKEPGVWGNKFAFEVVNDPPVPPPPATEDTTRATFTLNIYEYTRNTLVRMESFMGLSMNKAHARYFVSIVNSDTIGSLYVTVEDKSTGARIDSPLKDPTGGGSSFPVTYLAGGVDGTGTLDYGKAFDEFDAIDALLVVNAPGLVDASAIISKAQTRGDSFVVVDSDKDLLPSAVQPALPESSYCGVYYPWIHIPDPSPTAPRGSILKIPPGGSVVGMIMRTEATRGVFKAPAGLGAGLSGAVAVERRLSNDDLDLLAGNKINAIRPVAGSGITVMGARGRSGDIAQYISIRRTLNWVKKKAVDSSRFALFEPNTPVLWEQLIIANEVYLLDLWRAGGLQGDSSGQAFYVKCDNSNNTTTTIANGEVHIEIGVAPVFPAEFVIIRVGQFESDASVTVEEQVV